MSSPTTDKVAPPYIKRMAYRVSFCLPCGQGTMHELTGRPGAGSAECLRCRRVRQR